MGFPGRAVSHTNLAMTLLHQVIEFIEAQLRAVKASPLIRLACWQSMMILRI